ncbi:hypothetical protein K488DRAFT_69671 [Vararia minispora EC-137]|uniref:Uncharacterized protein n=1 Tax=Vararia minispora EC-137 TaxID=1314806 RepID=A0ACB8QPT6_9AGAM|nr:hypothetical protein K488DRAFT_69671 [Vararia minispora EC-137]
MDSVELIPEFRSFLRLLPYSAKRAIGTRESVTASSGNPAELFRVFTCTTALNCGEPDHRMQYVRLAHAMSSLIAVAVLLILRVTALYRNSRYVVALFIIVALAMIGVTIWSVIGQNSFIVPDPPVPGCYKALMQETQIDQHLFRGIRIASAWEAQVAFDVLIFIMVLYHSVKTRQQENRLFANSVIHENGPWMDRTTKPAFTGLSSAYWD